MKPQVILYTATSLDGRTTGFSVDMPPLRVRQRLFLAPNGCAGIRRKEWDVTIQGCGACHRNPKR